MQYMYLHHDAYGVFANELVSQEVAERLYNESQKHTSMRHRTPVSQLHKGAVVFLDDSQTPAMLAVFND